MSVVGKARGSIHLNGHLIGPGGRGLSLSHGKSTMDAKPTLDEPEAAGGRSCWGGSKGGGRSEAQRRTCYVQQKEVLMPSATVRRGGGEGVGSGGHVGLVRR